MVTNTSTTTAKSAPSNEPPKATAHTSIVQAHTSSFEAGHAIGTKKLRERGLSKRELEILELIAEGLDNKEIAARTYMSEGTVCNYVSTIFSKLTLKNRTQLAVFYYRNRQA